MRAKEYAERYIAEGKTKEALIKVWNDIFQEFQALIEIRHAQTNDAAISIFHELEGKWRAFARLANNNINPDGFRLVIEKKMPEIYAAIVFLEGRK